MDRPDMRKVTNCIAADEMPIEPVCKEVCGMPEAEIPQPRFR